MNYFESNFTDIPILSDVDHTDELHSAPPINNYDRELNENTLVSNERSWFARNKLKVALGVAAVSTALTFTISPIEETKDSLIDAAPWVATGVIASEVMFVAGGAMMLSATGQKIGNPLKLKGKLPEIARHANESTLFKSGFAVNALGAVGDFVVLSGAVVSELPPHSWGILGLTLMDLGVTIAVRKTMIDTIKDNSVLVSDLSDLA